MSGDRDGDKPARNEKTMRYDRGFQYSVLKLMVTDHQFCARACELLVPAHFLDRLSWFFAKIKEYYNDHGQLPTREVLSSDILAHKIDVQPDYYQDLEEMLAMKPAPEDVKQKMTSFIRSNMFVEAATTASNKYNNDRHLEAYTYIHEKMQDLFKANFNSDPFSRFGDYKAVLAQAEIETQGAIKIGIKAIDDEIGGLLPGTFTVWLGASNSGKSMLGPILAKQAADQGKKTFITVHEDEEIPTKLRYLACFSGISIQTLTYNFRSLTPEQEIALFEADQKLAKFVTLRFMYTNDATIENVMNVARTLMQEWPYELLICDYGQCLASTAKTNRGLNEVRHLHEHIYHMLKQLCLELKIAGTGGAQVNRNGMAQNRAGADYLRCTDVSEAYGIIKKATNVITMNRSNGDVVNDRIVFLLDKARNGKCPIAVECVSGFAKGTAYYPDRQQTIQDTAQGPGSIDDKNFENDKAKKQKLTVT